MAGVFSTPQGRKARKRAIAIVMKQRGKAEDELSSRDWGLVGHIAKNILKSEASKNNDVLAKLAHVHASLLQREESPATKAVVEALRLVVGRGGQLLGQIRSNEINLRRAEAEAALEDLERAAAVLGNLLKEES